MTLIQRKKSSSLAILDEPYLCPILNNPAHGRIQYGGHGFYKRLTYECNAGYTVVGPKERMCVSDGFWEPVADVYCIRKGTSMRADARSIPYTTSSRCR